MVKPLVSGKFVALSGGVGGAKLVRGLADCLAPSQLTVVANTADDFDYWGLRICPDLDSITYALADLNDEQRGWGLRDESWVTLEAMRRLDDQQWFQLGDRDLASHLFRTQALRAGQSLTAVTRQLAQRLGSATRLLPMTEQHVATRVFTDIGELEFQQYFVREQCRPAVERVEFAGIDQAELNPEAIAALADPALRGIIICPSNPFLSIDPILSLRGCREAIAEAGVPVVAVSPIVSGRAVKGPAAKMMRELNIPSRAAAVASYYGELLDGFIIDEHDNEQCSEIVRMGVECRAAQSMMSDLNTKVQLAAATLSLIEELA